MQRPLLSLLPTALIQRVQCGNRSNLQQTLEHDVGQLDEDEIPIQFIQILF